MRSPAVGEGHRVLADDVAGPHYGEPDAARLARRLGTVPIEDGDLG